MTTGGGTTVGSFDDLTTPEQGGVVPASTYLMDWTGSSGYFGDAHWLIVERNFEAGERHLVVGPYRGLRSATEAMVDSLLLDSLAEESCFDMYAVPHTDLDPSDVSEHEMVLIDEQDPAHHGRSRRPLA